VTNVVGEAESFGKAHFKTIGEGESPPAEFIVASSVDDVINSTLEE